jgi:hypothetical protein
MLPHENCRNWEYDYHPDRASLTSICAGIEHAVAADHSAVLPVATYDTRTTHKTMFRGLVPSTCKCLAGTYRGSNLCKPAHRYEVRIDGDGKVGVKATLVAILMSQSDAQCRAVEEKFAVWRATEPPPDEASVLIELSVVLAKIVERFFRIHPYANGNGHAGRFLLLVMMTRAGFPPADWSIDGKKPYSSFIFDYRQGNTVPLEDFILDSIAGPVAPTTSP